MLVVKIGGGKGISLSKVVEDIATLNTQAVIVHGCSFETDTLLRRLGQEPRYVTTASGYTTRVSDAAAMEVFILAALNVNRQAVQTCYKNGLQAVGLSGVDGGVVRAERRKHLRILENGKKKVLRGDYTGKITHINKDLLESLLEKQLVPVLAPLAVDEKGDLLNVDGDLLAAHMAMALGAHTLVILSNVEGVYADASDPASVINTISCSEIEDTQKKNAQGKMRKKLLSASWACAQGIKTIIASANQTTPVQAALAGQGTVVK